MLAGHRPTNRSVARLSRNHAAASDGLSGATALTM